ncbi:DUF4328 domain-containing protein [Solwaraspora sp. WMMD791]|uniref:DUF4328 domain-containing protein n=1 Tax=Solwaraspora sp. WMMD791 TaxID=3016086 RepID=UPI00249BAB31|nr:DUF4328 domain-containing protein [Solwaraspora sp. WMMD791]WFE24961.1 DUF4328 domain-containing protein [Solwaraspora sp. WMMD791]
MIQVDPATAARHAVAGVEEDDVDDQAASVPCATCGGQVGSGRRYCLRCNTPVGEPAVRPGVRTYRTHTLGTVTCVAIGAVVAAEVGYASWPLAVALLAEAGVVGDGDLLVLAALTVDLAFGLLTAALIVAACVPMIMWTYRVRSNLDAFPGAGATMSRGWAIAGWLVPVANLFVPYRVVANAARDSLWQAATPVVVRVWWAAFLGYQLLNRVASRQGDRVFTEVVDSAFPVSLTAFRAEFVSLVPGRVLAATASGVAAASIVIVIRQVSRAQEERLARAWPQVYDGARV